MRTGQYYLNRGGPYREFFPQVLAASEGRSYVDYAFHLAPMSKEHIGEIPSLIQDFGVTSFKIFMFYGGHGVPRPSPPPGSFLIIPPDGRDALSPLQFCMLGTQAAGQQLPQPAPPVF